MEKAATIEQMQDEINEKVERLLKIREFKEKYPEKYEAFLKLKKLVSKAKNLEKGKTGQSSI